MKIDLPIPDWFISHLGVMLKTGMAYTTIYRKMREGDFPKSISLAAPKVVWSEQEVNDWLTGKEAPMNTK